MTDGPIFVEVGAGKSSRSRSVSVSVSVYRSLGLSLPVSRSQSTPLQVGNSRRKEVVYVKRRVDWLHGRRCMPRTPAAAGGGTPLLLVLL
jgi:hypothetical protein